jgi:hypothetical protein
MGSGRDALCVFSGDGGAEGTIVHHGLLDLSCVRVGAPGIRRICAAFGDLSYVDPQDCGKARQDRVAVDAALASLHLGQPRLGSSDQPGERSL